MTVEIINDLTKFDINGFIEFDKIVEERLFVPNITEDTLDYCGVDEISQATSEDFIEWFEDRFGAVSVIALVKDDSNQIVGGCIVVYSSFKSVNITDFVITETASGKGYGKELLNKLLDYYVNQTTGITKLKLDVRAGEPAYSLYKKKGFIETKTVVGGLEDFDYDNGLLDEYSSNDQIFMELDL